MKKYSHKYNVILDNMDLNNYRIRPVAAIMYLQDAFARFTATKKMAAYDLFPENIYWVVGEFNIDFVDTLPFWSEEIMVEVWFSELSKLKIYTDFNIYSNGKLFSKGYACWFLINSESKRPVKIDDYSARIDVCSEFVLDEHSKFVLPDVKSKISEINHTINLSDLDFNNHVNNKSYINIAEMTMDSEYRKTHTIKSMRIKFIKETFMNDCLVCSAYSTELDNAYVYKIEKDGGSVCEILTVLEPAKSSENILNADLLVKKEDLTGIY